AFVSFGVQALGLIGSHGILPIADYLRSMREAAGAGAYWEIPTLLWLNASDTALTVIWIVGTLCGLAAAAGRWQRAMLAACLILWLSIGAAGQDFLSFQWGVVLLEAGFL